MAIRLLDLLPVHPVVTIPGVVKLLETTKPTAGKAVQLLESPNQRLQNMGSSANFHCLYIAINSTFFTAILSYRKY